MPLSQNAITVLNNVAVNTHIVDGLAIPTPRSQEHTELISAACENWAIRGLQNDAIDVPTLVDCVLLNTDWPAIVANRNMTVVADAIRHEIHNTFGDIHNQTISAVPAPSNNLMNQARTIAIQNRNQNLQNLHDRVADLFELSLTINGFIPSNQPTDYVVCMEYERAADQAMYPNFTHAWLMYRNRIIQTIPEAHISVSRHHAGHQPHCGFIRRYVADFLPNQLSVIENIARTPTQSNVNVTGCNTMIDVQALANIPTDQLPPIER